MKIPETFVPIKDLEEKIDELAKKIEEKESNKIMSTNCCMHGNPIILKFEKEKPTGIICSKYMPKDGGCKADFGICRYTSGFDILKPKSEDSYKK